VGHELRQRRNDRLPECTTSTARGPAEEIGTGETTTAKAWLENSQRMTLRELSHGFRSTTAWSSSAPSTTVAEQMGEAMEIAGGDGFLIYQPMTRHQIIGITDGLCPALRKARSIRSSYDYPTFRENLLAFRTLIRRPGTCFITSDGSSATAPNCTRGTALGPTHLRDGTGPSPDFFIDLERRRSRRVAGST